MTGIRSSWRRWTVPLVVGALFIAGLVSYISKSGSELPVYTLAAERMLAGDEIYRTDDPKPFTYPPFFALPLVPIVFLPPILHRPAWYLITFIALAAVLYALVRCVGPMLRHPNRPRSPPVWIFWLIVLVLGGRHVTAVLENQSHDLLVFLAVMWAAYYSVRGRDSVAGSLAGAGAACKVTPALFLPVFLWQRRFRAAAWLVLTGAVLTLLPDLLFPRNGGGSWAASWYQTFVQGIKPGETADVAGAWNAWNKLNQSLSGTIYRLTTEVERVGDYMFDVSVWNPTPRVRSAVTAGAQGLVLLVLWLATRRGLTRGLTGPELGIRRFGEAGAVVCAMVLLSPMSSKSHFCVLLVPIAFCTADLLYRKWDHLVAVLLGIQFVLGTLTVKQLLGKEIGEQLLARGTVTWCALSLLLATAYVLFRRSKAPGDRQPVLQRKNG